MTRRTLESLGSMIKEKRGTRKLREVATEIGISAATLMRLENGRTPDIGTFAKVCQWLKIDPRELMGIPIKDTQVKNDKKLSVTAHLRADKMPNQDTLKALASMIALAAQIQPAPNLDLKDADI